MILLAEMVAGGGRRPERSCTGGASRYPRVLREGRAGGGESPRGDSVTGPRSDLPAAATSPGANTASPRRPCCLGGRRRLQNGRRAGRRRGPAEAVEEPTGLAGTRRARPLPGTPVPRMPWGAGSPAGFRGMRCCELPGVPGEAAEGEAPSPRPSLASTAGRCSREQRGTEG